MAGVWCSFSRSTIALYYYKSLSKSFNQPTQRVWRIISLHHNSNQSHSASVLAIAVARGILFLGCQFAVSILWARNLKNNFRQFLQILHKHPLGRNNELIRFCWSWVTVTLTFDRRPPKSNQFIVESKWMFPILVDAISLERLEVISWNLA